MPHTEPSLEGVVPQQIPRRGQRIPFVSLGLWYGYPLCCIRWFVGIIEGVSNETPEYAEREKAMGFLGTGLRLCPTCLETKTMKEIYDEICARRQDPVPFPMQSSDLEAGGQVFSDMYRKSYKPFHARLAAHVEALEVAAA